MWFEGSVFDLLYDQVQPDEEPLVVHLDLVWSCDGLNDCILDDTNATFYSSDSFMVLGQGDLELNGGEFDVQGRDNLELGLNKILASPCDIGRG